MHVDLIRRIRSTLGIKPGSKSTLIKKQQLLRYARMVYEQNKQLRDILNPQVPQWLEETQARFEQINTKLIAYQTQVHHEKQKHQTLKSTVQYFEQFLEDRKKQLEEHKNRISQIKCMNVRTTRIKMDLPEIEAILNATLDELKEGDKAMVNLMKQFLDFQKELQKGSQLQQPQW